MKIASRILIAGAVCIGCASIVQALPLQVQMYKMNPDTLNTTWSYRISTKTKKDDPYVTKSSQIKSFKNHTSFFIETTEYNEVTVFPNSNGRLEAGHPPAVIALDVNDYSILREQTNALALDEKDSIVFLSGIFPIETIKKFTDNSIKVINTGSSPLLLNSWSSDNDGNLYPYYEDLVLPSNDTKYLPIEKNRDFAITIASVNKQLLQELRFKKSELSQLKKSGLKLGNLGQRVGDKKDFSQIKVKNKSKTKTIKVLSSLPDDNNPIGWAVVTPGKTEQLSVPNKTDFTIKVVDNYNNNTLGEVKKYTKYSLIKLKTLGFTYSD